jgi:Domain of unknown function (DUF6916)
MVNRRQVVGGLVSLVVIGSRSWSADAAPPKPGRVSLSGRLSKSVFRALRGETFATSGGDAKVSIQLLLVEDGPFSTDTEQFTVVFRGPHTPTLEEGSYTIRHRTAGSTTLFLRPTGSDARYSYYEAPFNLLL